MKKVCQSRIRGAGHRFPWPALPLSRPHSYAMHTFSIGRMGGTGFSLCVCREAVGQARRNDHIPTLCSKQASTHRLKPVLPRSRSKKYVAHVNAFYGAEHSE